jgi:hypothetical protein
MHLWAPGLYVIIGEVLAKKLFKKKFPKNEVILEVFNC